MELSREQLSALVDNELDEAKSAIGLLLAEDNESQRQQWARYYLIGEVLRGGSAEAMTSGLGARISAAIAREPSSLAQPAVTTRRARFVPRPAYALAAGLAAVGVIGVFQVINVHRQASPIEFANNNGARDTATAAYQEVSASELAEQRRRLSSYILSFNEQRDSLTLPKLHPYVRVVGFHNEGQP